MTPENRKYNPTIGEMFCGVLITNVFRENSKRFVEFICGCGNTQISVIGNFIRKPKKVCTSCAIKNSANSKRKYKCTDRRTYCIWKCMNYRCKDVNGSHYHRYGGRGIVVCDRWSEDNPSGFDNFYDDMGIAHGNLEIDRIDNDKGYEPSNCRWATRKQQANNMGRNKIVLFNNEKHTVSELSHVIGVKQNTITYRLLRGWTEEEVISGFRNKSFVQPYSNKLSIDEFNSLLLDRYKENMKLVDLAEKYNLDPSNLSRVFRKPKIIEYYKNNIEVKYESVG